MTGFAKDVARELDKRQRRRKLVLLAVWVVLIAAAVLYLRCGRGWGLGGGGDEHGRGAGSGTGTNTSTSTNASTKTTDKACQVRVSADGVALEGKLATTEGIVSTCKAVDVIVTGDAREGAWKQLCVALDAAHVSIVMRSDAQVCPP
jgi:hypothetical protein